jgi:hypothetical protein
MEEEKSKIGEYGFRWIPVEGYKTKKGKKILPHMKKVKFTWKEN